MDKLLPEREHEIWTFSKTFDFGSWLARFTGCSSRPNASSWISAEASSLSVRTLKEQCFISTIEALSGASCLRTGESHRPLCLRVWFVESKITRVDHKINERRPMLFQERYVQDAQNLFFCFLIAFTTWYYTDQIRILADELGPATCLILCWGQSRSLPITDEATKVDSVVSFILAMENQVIRTIMCHCDPIASTFRTNLVAKIWSYILGYIASMIADKDLHHVLC